jgi:opacity protein-like surface antigen
MKTTSIIFGILIIIGCANQAQAQRRSFRDMISLGGNFSFNRGRINQSFEVAPSIGYYWNSQIVSGVSLYAIGNYTRGKFNGEKYKQHYYMYGAGLYSRYYFNSNKIKTVNGMFLHTEYEYLKGKEAYEEKFKTTNKLSSHTYLLGAGYRRLIGERFSITGSLMLAISDDPVYSNPVVRIGFEF